MAAEDLARWSDALFGGRVLTKASLDEMLNFGQGGYGLGAGTGRIQNANLFAVWVMPL